MSEQLGFGFDEMLKEQETAHLPSAMEEAIPFYRGLLEKYHAAVMAGDEPAAAKISDEAHELAVKLNGGNPGILASKDAPAYQLERATKAPAGTVPMWGQTGDFTISVGDMNIRIKQDGIFGLGVTAYPGFSANAVDYDKPFLSETGYRSFIGCMSEVAPGRTPDSVALDMCEAYVRELPKGKLKKIEKTYVEREQARREQQQQERQP